MIVIGADEVGRGCLAGPLLVCAAAFEVSFDILDFRTAYLPSLFDLVYSPVPGVKDSKKFTSHAARVRVAEKLVHPIVLSTGYGQVSVEEINQDGMARSLEWAYERAIGATKVKPDLVLIDGNTTFECFPDLKKRCMPKADALLWPVAAASILAKVQRDAWMMAFHKEFPCYKFDSNKGYGTAAHIKALKEHGSCRLHRTQFVKTALSE